MSLTRGRDIHEYETRDRDNYRSGMHRTVVYEHLPSQAGVHFINKLPNKIKNASTPKVLKLVSNSAWRQTLSTVLMSFWHSTGRPRDEETDSSAESGRNWHEMNGEFHSTHAICATYVSSFQARPRPHNQCLEHIAAYNLILHKDRLHSTHAICATDVSSFQARPHPHNQCLEHVAAAQYRRLDTKVEHYGSGLISN
ncbi:hypothetical protein J6590_046862 [Homalodisca vitripennis]|nr:hypothetical protein J6590_046862 [Homalodisca vitripennis]